MTAGQKLVESEQMDCRGAGVVQTTSWVLTAVVASMASMASMVASMAPMAPMASMVVASMASMAWMDLMAPELKSEREKVQLFGGHLLHSTLCIKPLCFPFDQMSSWYSAADEFAFSCHTEGE